MVRFEVYFYLFLSVTTAFAGKNSSSYQKITNFFSADEFFVPTVESDAATCRNHSRGYVQNVKEQKWWATMMYDSTGKEASGLLYGASYEMGNFDECLDVIGPPEYNFTGQYCIGKFTVLTTKPEIYVESGDYNISVWDRITEFSRDQTKAARNELYLAYCIPSTCSYQDLDKGVQKYVEAHNSNQNPYKVSFEIQKFNCQTWEPLTLGTGDIIYIIFIIFSISLVTLSSVYDATTKRDAPILQKFPAKLHNILLCFSFPRNYKKLTSLKKNPDAFDCIAGMKLYSMILIVALHRAMFLLGDPMVNPKYIEEWYNRFETTILFNGPILVETFFTISGFLATFIILGHLHKAASGARLIMFYIHRVVRMSPTYAVVIAFYCTLLLKIGSGPLWQEKVGLEQQRCRASWWANLLYINNYINTDKICMFQSWFVTCDMNFFLLAPIISWILYKKPKLGILLTLSLLVVSILVVFVTVYKNNLDAIYMLYIKVLKDPVSHDIFKILYIPGHMRASSYFVGILTGYLKFQMKQNGTKISSKVITVGWILTGPLMIASLFTGYVFYAFEVSPFWTALYASLYHFLWSCAIAFLLIAISSGHGPYVEPLLSWGPLVVLSRLTYSLYISHGIIQIYTAASVRSPHYISIFKMIFDTAGDCLLAFMLAFVLSMMYENPFIQLERVLLYGYTFDKPQSKEKPSEEETVEES